MIKASGAQSVENVLDSTDFLGGARCDFFGPKRPLGGAQIFVVT